MIWRNDRTGETDDGHKLVNIVVYGAGAIGGQIAVRLGAAGLNPTVVEPWSVQREAMQAKGLTVHAQSGEVEHAKPMTISPAELSGQVELVFLCVKSYDTPEAMRVLAPRLAPAGLVVSMQNSINEEWIAPVIGAERVMGGVILINGSFLEPGHVQASSSVSRATASRELPAVYVGEFASSLTSRAERVADVLSHVWPSVPISDLLHERWSKMVNNTMLNPVSAVGGLKSSELLANEDARKIAVRIAAEVMRVAEAEGHILKTIMGDYAAGDVYADAAGESDRVRTALAERATRVSPDAMTSMYQDIRRGRKTEVDYFSGFVSRKGAGHGIAVPYCDAITALVHRVEAGDLAPGPSVLKQAFAF